MTTKRVKNGADTAQSVKDGPVNNWRGFVNIDLTDAQKEAAMRLTETNLDFLGNIETAVAAGYRLSVTFTPNDGVYNATLTGQERHETDAGIAVSARSTKVEYAIAAVIVKASDVAGLCLARLFDGTSLRQVDL
jgi:hypothetical protein